MKNSTKSKQKYKSKTGILKINLDVENIGSLGVKITKKGDKIYIKINVSRIPPIPSKSTRR